MYTVPSLFNATEKSTPLSILGFAIAPSLTTFTITVAEVFVCSLVTPTLASPYFNAVTLPASSTDAIFLLIELYLYVAPSKLLYKMLNPKFILVLISFVSPILFIIIIGSSTSKLTWLIPTNLYDVFFVLSPSCPYPLYPAVYTFPASSATKLLLFVNATKIAFSNSPCPYSPSIFTNLLLCVLEPSADAPYALYPAVHALLSFLIIAVECCFATISFASVMLFPLISFASTGSLYVVVFPWDNWP